MAKTTKGTQQQRRSKGDGSIFPNKRGGWTARYRRKGLPDKEFNASTKGEVKKMLDDWKVKVAVQDAITSNIKVADYAEKYLYRKSESDCQKSKFGVCGIWGRFDWILQFG